VYQRLGHSAPLFFEHIFGDSAGYLVTLTGQQARLQRPDARANELEGIRQKSFRYPDKAGRAADYLLGEAQHQRDAYVGVHLFCKPGTRKAEYAAPTVQSLWLDEDDGSYPELGPQPTAVVSSSRKRRHLYWQLTHAVSVEWAVEMNRRVAIWAGGDVGKAGLATVLRVPGTANFKRHPQVDLVAMEITHSGSWEPEVMDQAIPELSEPTTSSPKAESYDGPALELAEFLSGVDIIGEVPDGLGKKLAVVCPWLSEHTGGDRTGTYVGQRAGGGLWFYCNHEHCQGRTWAEFRRASLGDRRGRKIAIETPPPNDDPRRVVIRLD